MLGFFGISAASPCVFAFDYGTPGSPYVIQIRTSGNVANGLTCEGAAGSQFLVRHEASSVDGVNFTTRDVKIDRVADRTLNDGVVNEGTITNTDPNAFMYFSATCNGQTLFAGPGG